ncbi:cytochrome P450 4C1-like [Vespa mandarinia]|uniref:cytochrome P450 4C1-like n=1 Tax=Vespa mandarinia TaxID=7446 RepID=UPI001622542D|nr:cytochrome P450 4C1-like [Vespa mandarinia]
MFNKIKGISGPKAYPIIGNIHLFIGDIAALLNQILNLDKNYQLLWRVWLGIKLFVIVDNPEYIKTVFNSPNITDKSVEYEKFKPFVGNGLLTAPASLWNRHRKMLNDVFLLKHTKSHMDLFINYSIVLMKKLETSIGEELDVFHYIFRCTLDIIYGRI